MRRRIRRQEKSATRSGGSCEPVIPGRQRKVKLFGHGDVPAGFRCQRNSEVGSVGGSSSVGAD